MSKLPSQLAGACSAVLAAALLAVPGLANATGIKIYSYAVKFICEEENSTDVDTSVNVHNPSLTQSAEFKLKVVEPDNGFYCIREDRLYADKATSLDCDFFDVAVGVAPATINNTDFEGWIVVLSPKPLDVAGVYEVENSDETEDVDVVPVAATTQTVTATQWNTLCPN